jgi:hypothetical protein
MSKNRFARQVTVVAGFIFLCAVPGIVRADNTQQGTAQAPKVVSPGAQQKSAALPPDDFAGLNYTDEQKSELDKIHRDTESHKEAVVKDEKLTTDQKNAMLLGYTRMEYGMRFKALSPEQKRQVCKRMLDRRAADQSAQKKRPPRN